MFSRIPLFFCIFLMVSSFKAYAADDLLQTFHYAYQYDPQFRMKEAMWHSHEQKALVERSLLLPQLELQDSYQRQTNQSHDFGDMPASNTTTISLDLKQPIFNATSWFNYKGAKVEAKALQAEYGSALQDLMARTTEFYFDVLVAQHGLSIKQQAQRDYKSLLQWAKTRFEAGFVKSADVAMIAATYQQSLVDVIDAENKLVEKRAHLQTITGVEKRALALLKTNIPLIKPRPFELQAWIASISKNNLLVLADQYKLQTGKANIQAQNAGHYPTLNLKLGESYIKDNSPYGQNGSNSNISVTLALPVYSGGKTTAQTRQAAYDYQTSLEQARQNYQMEREKVQNNYEGVINGILRLQADNRILTADQQALKSVDVAYRAGLSSVNMQIVINARNTLYQHQQMNFQHKRDYIVSLVKLKQAAGLLSMQDLVQLNGWLQ